MSGGIVDVDFDKVVQSLWRGLDSLDEAGFSLNPLDLVQNVAAAGRLVDRIRTIATQPPPGDPAASVRAAHAWSTLARGLTATTDKVDADRVHRRSVWTGSAARAFDATAVELDRRLTDAATGARRAAVALEEHAEALARAQRRHGDVAGSLRRARDDIPRHPGELDQLDDVVRHLREALNAALESWRDAGAAAKACASELAAVEATMPFPDGAAPGMRALDALGQHGTGSGRLPLVDGVLERARAAYEAMSAQDRAAFDALMADAASQRHRAWLLAALAAGHPIATLRRFAQRINRAPDPDALLDPQSALRHDGPFTQTTGTTCGSSSLVYASMLRDPALALRVLTGYDATTGQADDPSRTPGDRFKDLETEMKRRTDDPRVDPDRGWRPDNVSMPWIPALGTSPWAAAEELDAMAPDGVRYEVDMVDPASSDDKQDAYRSLVESTDQGHPAILYVGDETAPRHVVLVYAHADGSIELYEPGHGQRVVVTQEQFVAGEFSVGGWPKPWAVVTP
ncbi:WXG100 family type VII secretion target [Cellulomonas gelida]|uniref:Uncharacterized protein n=2 Tax=Cellulomonas TaxID=1707 RepID=A0A4Y3KJJ2_9CELL|nr:hypothetical protein [Cellulomonas gelida]GEA83275.1 hypothetical protein CGE01nite_05260 [Cellulomonas gelida]GGL28803.1 hypothetical protein GCM10009774_18920 [Cellulomonas gelida]